MNIINKFTMNGAVLCLGITLLTSCSGNSHKEEDPKDAAKNANEEKFDSQGEKDADLVVGVHMGNLFEIMSAENAITKASTSEVKKLAEMIKTAHTKMDKDLAEFAARKNITLAADLSDDQKRKMEKQNEKTGIDFDKEYTGQMKNAHEETIKVLEKGSEKAEDGEVKQFFANAIPEVRSHLTMIETCWANIKDMKEGDHKDHMDHKDHADHKDHVKK